MTTETAHIDKQKGRDPEDYYATFVDLMIAINARCIGYGIGYYAVFASKISFTHCTFVYELEQWGGNKAKAQNVRNCVLEDE